MQNQTDKIASKFLGKKVEGSDSYDSSLLVAVPRVENRKQYGIDSVNLPFCGFDVWHAYEFSTMTLSGLPVTRLIKLKYPCSSEFIVESKSLKLYLNSFNMTRFGNDIQDCLHTCKKIIIEDLSKLLGTKVDLSFLDNLSHSYKVYADYSNLYDIVDTGNVLIDKFKEAPDLLKTECTNSAKEYFLTFDSLRSNCRVTHQPDFADAFIYYKSNKHILEDSLLKYLVSFRSEYHFHEECCEMIYKRLYDILDIFSGESALMVSLIYTRRGGIDICPSRWSENCYLEDVVLLNDITKYVSYGVRQ